MPKREDIQSVLVIGSGPIIIGQAAEFDYAGTQACLSLKEEGYRVILVNSNPATIMTDTEIADKVYIEPITLEFVSRIIRKERPDAILPTLGGQTGLNMAMELAEAGILEECNVEVLGTDLAAIKKAEDREAFRSLMNEIGEPVPESIIIHTIEEARSFVCEVGFPVIVRPAYTLGGTGGGICHNEFELEEIVASGLKLSPVTQCLLERSIAGYKEIEYEVMRDKNNNAMVVCNMENIDPVGIHTGDSVVIAPSQTLSDREYQLLRNVSLKIIRALKIEGGCNVQLALDPNSYDYYVIEVNPRVSRSSALASKATGYPIAKLAAKIAVGLTLDEVKNPVTGTTFAHFEPTLDYVVAKIPRFPFDKFEQGDRRLGTQMKATGEVMAIGRTCEEALLKAVRSLEIGANHLYLEEAETATDEKLDQKIRFPEDDRLFYLAAALRRGEKIESLHKKTKIDLFFLYKLQNIIQFEAVLKSSFTKENIYEAKRLGFSDPAIGRITGKSEEEIYTYRKREGILPVFKMVDTCAAEFESSTPYFYSSYEEENESIPTKKESVIVLGSGPIRIGQGVEFDYATVHSVLAIQQAGYEAIIINNNPETVSTDFSISDKLYFEPLTLEDVMHVIEIEKPKGIIVQFGGQTAINLAQNLSDRGVKILGTRLEDIERAENRDAFEKTLAALKIPQPEGKTATSVEEAIGVAQKIGYPVLVRPSYVLGGRAMEIVESEKALIYYMDNAVKVNPKHPVLVDRYVRGHEVEVDAISDGENVVIPGIMEHIERAGVHSGDSIAVYPAQSFSQSVTNKVIDYTTRLAKGLRIIGMLNIQYVVQGEEVFVIEVNPRSSRTAPFLSKITGIPMANVATKVILGKSLLELGFNNGLAPQKQEIFVKVPVFSFAKLRSVDTSLGPEMKSTGEVMGKDSTLEKALYKGFVASGTKMHDYGTVLLTISDRDKQDAIKLATRFNKIGFTIMATSGTARVLEENNIPVSKVKKIGENQETLIDYIRSGQVTLVVNTLTTGKRPERDGFQIRRESVENGVPVCTSLDTAEAILRVLESRSFELEAMAESTFKK